MSILTARGLKMSMSSGVYSFPASVYIQTTAILPTKVFTPLVQMSTQRKRQTAFQYYLQNNFYSLSL